ncbi:class D sortase [Bacillus sp. Marseille-Q3570]|uniref:class D sortase n=1 Tax=Bacillus sp. Marseille-Q3570 TaxID=2963522 RepID=UPI0021B6FB5E|nr:class D sortase [Bacillus sp. Marseille-Q3570]
MRFLLGLFIFLIGLGTAFIPYLKSQYSIHQQQQLLSEWNQTDPDTAEESFTSLSKVYASDDESTEAPSSGELVGTVEIPSIDARLPVLEGATLSNLKKGAGHLSGTSSLGQFGNSAIAAHRSYTYGKDFNRLNEVVHGDEIIIKTKDETYTYTVYHTTRVLPDDTSVLASDLSKTIVTLITCDPMKDPTHRLIVQAKLKNP